MRSLNRLAVSFRPILAVGAAILVPISLYLIFFYAPMERVMGPVQKIFYYHVPSAIVSFLAFFLVMVGSTMYLLTRKRNWDLLAGVSAELGVVFCAIVLITGPLWARPTWGVYWTWDVRLTTTLLMWLMYVGYLMLKVSAKESPKRASISAIYGIFCFANVPIVHFSVRYFRSIHPHLFKMESVGKPALSPAMSQTFFFCMVTITVLFGWVLLERLALAETEEEIELIREHVRQRVDDDGLL